MTDTRHTRCLSSSTVPVSPIPQRSRSRATSQRFSPSQNLKCPKSPQRLTSSRAQRHSGIPTLTRSFSLSCHTPSSSTASSPPPRFSSSLPLPGRSLPATPALEIDASQIMGLPAAAPSEKGPSSPCSPTSTTHLATPEWASPAVSFRSYMDQLSIDTHESVPIWSKRSLSMSNLTPFPFSKKPCKPDQVTPRKLASFSFHPKRLRPSSRLGAQNPEKSNSFAPISPVSSLLEEEEQNSDTEHCDGCYFTKPSSSYQRAPSKSLYISFPSISDDIDEDDQPQPHQQYPTLIV